MASYALHNYLIEINQATSSPPKTHDLEMFDDETIIQGSTLADSHMIGLDRRQQGNVTNAAKKIRSHFINYFVNEG